MGAGMKNTFDGIEPLVHKSQISVPYHWWAGETASRFFVELRDTTKIMGTRCDGCGKTFVPPRKTCPVCFTENTKWVECGPFGTVTSFTVVRKQQEALHHKVPVIFALVLLDGADTSLLHRLDEVSPEDVKIGMKVEASFNETRDANMTAIAYFKPAS